MNYDFGLDITPEDANSLQNVSFKMVGEDRDSCNYRCKITYRIGHLGEDKYSIDKIEPSSNYFSIAKKICNHTINELTEELNHDFHFYPTNTKKFNDFIKDKGISFERDLNGGLIKHFSVNQNEKGELNKARVHFVIGAMGELNILLFDPDHEI